MKNTKNVKTGWPLRAGGFRRQLAPSSPPLTHEGGERSSQEQEHEDGGWGDEEDGGTGSTAQPSAGMCTHQSDSGLSMSEGRLGREVLGEG